MVSGPQAFRASNYQSPPSQGINMENEQLFQEALSGAESVSSFTGSGELFGDGQVSRGELLKFSNFLQVQGEGYGDSTGHLSGDFKYNQIIEGKSEEEIAALEEATDYLIENYDQVSAIEDSGGAHSSQLSTGDITGASEGRTAPPEEPYQRGPIGTLFDVDWFI